MSEIFNEDDSIEMMTAIEVAKILKVTTQTINRLIKKGKIPAYLIGNQYRINKKVFINFINTGVWK